jgi:predicted O-methyltransferase YrrM
MNDTIIKMKGMLRAMRPFCLLLYEYTLELKAQNVLELGARQMQSGRSFLSALYENGSGLLTSVDLADRSERVSPEMLKHLRMIVGNTHNADTIRKVADREYDLMLIDAGHSYEDVKQDYKFYEGLVRPGGLIFFHDVVNNITGVPKFWNELQVPNKITLPYFPGLGIIQKP